MLKYFNNIDELITQAQKDGACKEGLDWARNYDDLDTLLSECPADYAYWALKKGYAQFANCKELTANDWAHLLVRRPELARCCNLEMLEVYHWVYILTKQPYFFQYCDYWEKFEEKFEDNIEVMEFIASIPCQD